MEKDLNSQSRLSKCPLGIEMAFGFLMLAFYGSVLRELRNNPMHTFFYICPQTKNLDELSKFFVSLLLLVSLICIRNLRLISSKLLVRLRKGLLFFWFKAVPTFLKHKIEQITLTLLSINKNLFKVGV